MVLDTGYLVSARIGLGKHFGVSDEEAWIEVREVSVEAMTRMQQAISQDQSKQAEAFLALLPKAVVDHSFWRSETEKLTPEELAAYFGTRAELCLDLVARVMGEVFFSQGMKERPS